MSGEVLTASALAARERIEDSADVVIVGSGAAGATAARVLAEAGLEVIVVEEGPFVPTEALVSDMYTSFKRVWRGMGMQVAEGRAFTPILQGRCVGGTTAVNGAIMHRIPEAIHALWQAEHGLGNELSYTRLTRAYDRLDSELHVGTAPEDVLGNNSKLMRRGVESLGWRGNLIRRNVDGCLGTAHCNQGCPTARRQSMNVSYIPRALELGARVYADCTVLRLEHRGGRASGVSGRLSRKHDGKRPSFQFHARHAVLVGASAIQTPLLLLDNGIGVRSGVLGRRLQAHPGAGVVGVFDEPVRLWFGATQGYESTQFWNERMKFESVSMPLEFGAARLPGIGPALMKQIGSYEHLAIWGVQVRARAHGRVRRGLLGAPVIEYDMTSEDLQVLKLGVYRLCEMMFSAGAREVMPGVHGLPERIRNIDDARPLLELPDDPRLFHCIAAHLFGTAVLGADARHSVVDKRGECHDLPGLYLIDSSIFPTNMGVNPQHTICAVSWLLAESILERLAA